MKDTVVWVFGISLENLRVPTAVAKKKILRAIRVARKVMPLSAIESRSV